MVRQPQLEISNPFMTQRGIAQWTRLSGGVYLSSLAASASDGLSGFKTRLN